MKKNSGKGKFVFGVLIGAGLGVLFAPRRGSETRKELKKKIDEIILELKNVDIDEVRENIEIKVEEIQAELEDLDKEKVLKEVKKKGKELKKKTDELVKYAVDKGTPVLQNMANDIKDKTVKVLKEMTNKLEKNK